MLKKKLLTCWWVVNTIFNWYITKTIRQIIGLQFFLWNNTHLVSLDISVNNMFEGMYSGGEMLSVLEKLRFRQKSLAFYELHSERFSKFSDLLLIPNNINNNNYKIFSCTTMMNVLGTLNIQIRLCTLWKRLVPLFYNRYFII